jgi:hypothetical protein
MLMVVAVGCTRSSSKSPPVGIARQAPSTPRRVAIAGDAGNVEAGAAGTGMAAANAHCRVEPDGGRLLAGGSDLRDVRLVANGGRAMATWASHRPRSGNTELEAFAAILGSDGSVQETRSIAKDLFETGARPSSRSFLGAIPLVTAGGLALVTCEHLVISGAFQCSMVSVDGWRPTAKVPYRSHFFIGPRLSLGAAALGNGFVAFVGEHAALAVASSARKIPKSTKGVDGIEWPGAPISLLDVDGSSFPEGGLPIAPIEAVALGSDSALGVFRMGPSIRWTSRRR